MKSSEREDSNTKGDGCRDITLPIPLSEVEKVVRGVELVSLDSLDVTLTRGDGGGDCGGNAEAGDEDLGIRLAPVEDAFGDEFEIHDWYFLSERTECNEEIVTEDRFSSNWDETRISTDIDSWNENVVDRAYRFVNDNEIFCKCRAVGSYRYTIWNNSMGNEKVIRMVSIDYDLLTKGIPITNVFMVHRTSDVHMNLVTRHILFDEDTHCEHFQLVSCIRVTVVRRNGDDTARRNSGVNLVDIVDLTLDHLRLRGFLPASA
nr:MAG TPA: hypothetical protein [Caudoviricetes sp.]